MHIKQILTKSIPVLGVLSLDKILRVKKIHIKRDAASDKRNPKKV